jgi:hypothetical protein
MAAGLGGGSGGVEREETWEGETERGERRDVKEKPE